MAKGAKRSKNSTCQAENDGTRLGPPTPPDGGWGWMIMLASFLASVIVDGVCFSFGIFLLEFLEYYGESKMKTSWVGSTLNGMYLTIGPLVGALANRFGCRIVAITGSVVAAIGFFISTWSPNVTCLIILYGAVGGLGFGLLYLPAIVMVGFYFEKRRALATGVAVCGSGIGTFIFAPLSQKLLDVYNWQGATWIISGVVLNGVILGALFRPLEPSRVPISRSPTKEGELAIEEEETDELLEQDSKPSDENGTFCMNNDNKVNGDTKSKTDHDAKAKLVPKNKQLELLKMNVRPDQKLFKSAGNINAVGGCRKRTISEGPRCISPEVQPSFFLSCDQIWVNASNKDANVDRIKQDMQRPLYKKDIFYAGSVKNIPEFAEQKDMSSYIRSITSIPTTSCEAKTEDGGEADSEQCCGTMRNVLSNMMDFSLMKSPTFLVYGLSCFLCMIGFFVPFMFLPDHSIKMGIDKGNAAFLLSILGIANTVARVFSGWLADQPWADALIINNVALLIGGISTMLVPFCFNYALLAVYGVVFGMCIAAFVSLRSIIMVELMGLQRLTNAFGLVTMCQGLSSFIGAPIAGSIYDVTGNYDISFYFAGATLALAGIICFPLRRISQWEKRKLSRLNDAGCNEMASV